MKKTYIYAGISIFLWSTLATVSKLLLETLDSFQVLLVSALFAVVALFLIILLQGNLKKLKEYRLKDYCIMALIGLPGTFFYNVFLYMGMDRMKPSQAFIINYLWPIMSVVFACILLKEKLTVRKIIAFALSFVGVITVAGEGLFHFQPQIALGILFCVLAAISYGAFTALNQKWHYDKFISMMVANGVCFVLSFAINAARDTLWMPDGMQLLGLGWNGVGVMAIATVTWALALDAGNTAKISNLAYITPFISLIWTSLIVEKPDGFMPLVLPLTGLCIIVLGIMVQLKDNSK